MQTYKVSIEFIFRAVCHFEAVDALEGLRIALHRNNDKGLGLCSGGDQRALLQPETVSGRRQRADGAEVQI